MHTAIITFFILVAVVFFWAAAVKHRILMTAKRRVGLTEEQFVCALAPRGVPHEIGHAVFAGFRKWSSCISSDFPITPDLPLVDFVPWVEHDEVDVIHEILAKTGRHWPPEKLLPLSSTWTLEDVAKFVSCCPKVK